MNKVLTAAGVNQVVTAALLAIAAYQFHQTMQQLERTVARVQQHEVEITRIKTKLNITISPNAIRIMP